MKKKSRRTNKTLMYVSQARKIDEKEEALRKNAEANAASAKKTATFRRTDVAILDSARNTGYQTARATVKPMSKMEMMSRSEVKTKKPIAFYDIDENDKGSE